LAIAHECDYQSDKIHQRLENHIEFTWTQEQMTQFHAEIFRHRKNLVAVAKIMNLPVSTVYVYYLSHYKKSNDYRLLKWVCEEERQTKLEASEQGWEGCVECGEGGNLLICDGCDAEYHMMCTKPPLMEVPEGAWYCDVCVDTQFLAIRDHVISKFYKPVHPSNQDITNKELVDKERDNIVLDDVALRPVEAVVKAVKNLAITLSQALKP
jgi:PHD-finger